MLFIQLYSGVAIMRFLSLPNVLINAYCLALVCCISNVIAV